MKFGKRLLAEAERQWLPQYVDYKALKQAIKTDIEFPDPTGPAFQQLLAAELHKVSTFYFRREDELAAAMAALTAGPPGDAAALAALRSQLHHLRKYVVLNYIAVVKAVKKRNRHLTTACAAAGAPPPLPLHSSSILTAQPFYTSVRLAALATRVEILAAEAAPAADLAGVVEDFTCPICLRMLCDPVVLSCSHRFCWGCMLALCSQLQVQQGHGGTAAASDGKLLSGVSSAAQTPLSPTTTIPATWASDCEEEDATVATFACPCCRQDHLLDLDRLQVDQHLSAFLLKLPAQGSTAVDLIAAVPSNALEQVQAEAARVAVVPPQPEASLVLHPTPVPEEPPALLPPLPPHHANRLCVCLDLDGTLVTTFAPKRAPSLPPSAVSYVVGRGGQLNPGGVFVVERPGLGEFLHHIAGFSEVVLFTAGLEDYARPILDEIEARYGKFAYRLYRPATLPSEHYPCVKDLSRLGRRLERCVLVDDTPLAFLHQQDNGIPVLQYRGDVDDRMLMEAVAPLLEALAAEPDVRRPLSRRFGMQRWFAAQGLKAEPPRPAVALAAAAAVRPTTPALTLQVKPRPLHAPSAAQLRNTRMSWSDVLLVFDFDRTLTDFDAGERLCDELAPELTSLLSQVQSPANFIPATNAVLAEMQRRGISRDALVGTLRRMGGEIPRPSLALLRWASTNGIDTRILSDCNSLFISHMLIAAGVHSCVREVVTNAATFERVELPASADGGGGGGGWFSRPPAAKAAGHASHPHRLVIAPRHQAAHAGHHGCPLCPTNLCKGRELDALRTLRAAPHRRVIYAGDGANDLCPALCLGPEDVVLARAGHPLDRLIKEGVAADGEGDARRVVAQVRVWHSHEELLQLVQAESAA